MARRAHAVLLAALLAALAGPARASVRVKELADVQGVRENQLFGYGLVVGLAGTGDTERVLFTQQSIANLLGRLGIRLDPAQVMARNVAAVMVTARLPAFARPGAEVDVAVGSMGNATSIAGGVLLLTPLAAADGQVYAVAQGPVQVGGYAAGVRGQSYTVKNTPTTGRIPAGAIVERSVAPALASDSLVLGLHNPDFTTASRVAAAVNTALGAGAARAVDPASIEVKVPDAFRQDAVGLVAKLEVLEVEADSRARVVVSERTGTVVAGERVRIRPATVAHGGLSVSVQRTPIISQPAPWSYGTTAKAAEYNTTTREESRAAVALPATSSVEDLAKALNLLGATPRDLIAILQALKAAGSLDAELEVQ
ncbi:MAG TPA: flagellar basal body P-ring protein FlgI [Anaeromyxobacteraceae bacterium]|nr:flagellar basal body P-ring protein FlgI [Anaeromyxobacteraceae bacterium]